jgi:hypothetical protein
MSDFSKEAPKGLPRRNHLTALRADRMPPEARGAVEEAFLRVMRARHPEFAWELLSEEQRVAA